MLFTWMYNTAAGYYSKKEKAITHKAQTNKKEISN